MAHEYIEYSHQGTQLQGYLAFHDDKKPRPLVIIAHAWRGRDDFVKDKADEILQLGYNAFAWDMYGKDVLGTSVEENTRLMTPFMEDRNFLQERMHLALHTISKHPCVDKNKIAAIGFCFGGLCVLDLARSGANIKGVISFHGLLMPPPTKDTNILAKVLVLHGYNDPMAPPEQVDAFAAEMNAAKVDWQIHWYGNTVHAFTNPIANDPKMGTVYDAKTAARAWQAARNFFAEIFK